MATTRSKLLKDRVMRHIKADEVSLVEYPATFRKFFVVKGKGSKMEDKMVEALVNLCGDDAPDDFEETLKNVKLQKKEANVLRKTLSVLNEYQEEFPDEVNKAIGVMATAAGIGFTKSVGNEKTGKVRLSVQDRESLDNLGTAVAELQETTEKLKSALNSEKKRSKKAVSKRKGANDDSGGEKTVSFTKEDLENFVDGIASQTLQGVGLINASDVKKSEREDDDPFLTDEDEIEEDRDGDDDDRLYEDADEEYDDDDDDEDDDD